MKFNTEDRTAPGANAPAQPQWLGLVRERVSGLRYGVVQIVIHDGRVTQVESTERFRVPADPAAGEV